MKENFIKKIISPCILAICMIVVLMFIVTPTKASDTSDESIKVETITGYTAESLTTMIDTQATNGYLYAGLFKAGTTADNLTKKNVVASPKDGSTYVAKFVPEGVMGIKAQVSSALLSNSDLTASSVRMVTAVDSLTYKEIGFSITRVGDDGQTIELVEQASITPYVYAKLYGVDVTVDNPGEPMEYTPKDIHTLANYFKTYTIRNVPDSAYNTELTVVPYWKTFDGKTVHGTTGIKTVNLGRSWVYVNTTGNSDGTEYGTYDHPFTEAKFATALDNIALDKAGIILLQSDYAIPSGFDWKSHGKDIIVTSVDGTQTLSFGDTNESIRDGVTFKKMVLTLPTGSVYACGNNFTIESDVTSENSSTVIYGGAYNAEVESTNVTIKKGTYRAIYGGGALAGGIVSKNTNVTIENSNVYNTETSHDSRVHGGGNKAIVKGDTYVTIGTGFNADLEYTSDKMYSTVYGGGFGAKSDDGVVSTATVEGDTYVYVQGGAKANYIFGAGGPYSTVEGTSHIYFEAGYAMGIYGGANSTEGVNSHTFVKMTGGIVEQIFGGNHKANANMGANIDEIVYADVQVLDGTVTRRIYGGCYNDYDSGWSTTNSVEGYSSVTIGSSATISNRSDSTFLGNDTSVCSISRLAENASNEIGVMVLNPEVSSSDVGMNIKVLGSSISSAMYTNFLVNVSEGGTVVSERGLLHISTDTENNYNYATVTYGDKVLGYVKGDGKCSLPELTDKTAIQNIQVTFSQTEPEIAMDNFVAKNISGENVAYYASLEEAIEMAENGTEIVVLKDITVSSAQEIAKDITLTSESAVTITRDVTVADNMFTVTSGTFSIIGTVDTMITLEGNKDTDGSVSARAIRVETGATCETNYVTIQNFSVEGSAGAVSCSGTLGSTDSVFTNNSAIATTGATGGAIYASGESNVTITRCQFTSNTASNGGGAIHILATGTVTSDNSIFSSNKTTNTGNGNGGAIYCQGTYNDTNSSYLNNISARNGGAIIVQSGAQAAFTGADSNAEFSGNSATANANGNAVYVNGGATVSITGYSFADDTQKMLAAGTLTFGNITGATIVQGSAGKIYVAGYDAEANMVEVKPKEYAIGTEVLQQAESLTDDSVFQAACEDITVTTDADNNYWWIKSDGTLMQGVARIETEGVNTYYNSLSEAVSAANTDGGTGDTSDIVIYVYKDVALSGQIAITKNIVIQNEPGETVTISRGTTGVTENMFYIGNSNNNLAAKLTLGSNETSELGALIINGGTATSGRIVENRATATFILGRNTSLQNTSNTNWGAVLCNRGTAELNGIVKENTCEHAGGAIIQVQVSGKAAPSMRIVQGEYTDNMSKFPSGNSWGGVIRVDAGTLTIEGGNFASNSVDKLGGVVYAAANTEVTITGGTFSGNTADEEGSAIYCLGILNCKDATFEGETEQTIYVNDEFTFDNITGATIVQGASATLNAAGYDAATNEVTVTPNTYTAGIQLLNKSSNVEDAEFDAACADIKVTPDAENNDWWIDSDGVLMKGEARIGDTYYNTLSDAVEAANTSSTETNEDIVIEILKDVEISSQVTVLADVQIVNQNGKNITITRSTSWKSGRMFYTGDTTANMFTLGTNDTDYQGRLIVQDNGEYKSGDNIRIIDNRANGTFILGKNATLQNANSNQRGSALVNRGTTYLYGNIKNNTCTGDGGAILQVSGTLTVYDGIYTENQSTKSTSSNTAGGLGSVITVIGGTVDIQGGTFTGNSTASRGGVLHSVANSTVKISGGNFSGNTSAEGGAIYCYGSLEVTGPITDANGITVTPSTYEKDKVMLTKAEGVTDEAFKTACASIIVTPDADGLPWLIDANGTLQMAVASVGNTYYSSLDDAIAIANASDTDTTVYVYRDVELEATLNIQKNITLESKNTVKITRGTDVTGSLFTVETGKFSLKGSANAEFTIDGQIDITGTTTIKVNAINVASGAELDMQYVTIQNFYADKGGAVYCNGTMTATNSTFTSNRSSSEGGAIYALSGSEITLTTCELTENQAGTGGAINIVAGGSVTSSNSTFSENKSTGNGGAIYCKGTYMDTNSNFISNSATGKGGALIVFTGGSATLDGGLNAKFDSNKANTTAKDKGHDIYTQVAITVKGYAFENITSGSEQRICITSSASMQYKDLTGIEISDTYVYNSARATLIAE